MGYRFELQHANMVAHLIDGNVDAFFDCFSGEKDFYPLKEFIRSHRHERRFFSSREYEHEFERIIDNIEHFILRDFHIEDKKYLMKNLYDEIFYLSRHIRRAKVKALLLPSREKDFISDIRMLEEIVDIHPEDSCLILQTPPLENKQSVQLFNVFRSFEEALKHYDEFPGVLLWDDEETLFIPVDNERDTIGIFQRLLLNARKPIQALKKYYSYKLKKKDYIYLFHLSDLHLGKVNHSRTQELIRLIDTHSIHQDNVPIIPVITGDLMDTPSKENKNKFDDFIDKLNTKFIHKLIFVLGNHDVDKSGIFSLGRSNKQATMSLLNPSNIEKFDEYKLIIIKFCSNKDGHLAQGEIGEEQLLEIAKQLDKVENIKDYSLVALLHHHPIEINTPNWYKEKWYERILGKFHEDTMKLNDADRFIDWCKERDIKVILHGHKHIPNIAKVDGVGYIGAGSSTGNIQHTENGKTYISFNVIKYDLSKKRPTQAITYFEETIGTDVKHISVEQL